MSNARDEDRVHRNSRRKREGAPVTSAPEEIGAIHFSTENYSTALEYFQKALRSPSLKDYPDRFRLLLRVVDCYRQKGSYREAHRYLKRARALAGDDAPEEAIAKMEYREGFILLQQGHYDDALKRGFSAYRRLKRSDEHNEVAYTQLLIANCYQRLGQSTEAEEFFMDSLSSYRRIEDKIGIAYVYNSLGLLHKNACRWNRALASLSKARELSELLGLTQHLIRVHLNLGVVYAKLRRFSEAQSAFARAAEMAERFGDQYKLTKALFMQGRTYIQCGEFCKAEKYILRAQAMANELGYQRESALTDEYLGELMIARGKPREAIENLTNGLKRAKAIAPEGDVVAEIIRRMADARFMLGEADEALALVEDGLRLAERCGELYEIGFFHRTRSLCLRRKGDLAGAIGALRDSVNAFSEHDNAYEKHLSQQLLGRMYLRSGEQENLLKARHALSDSSNGLGRLEETRPQMLSQVVLAIVEERLGNLDDALLAVYEGDRLADEEHDTKFKKLLSVVRARIERRMTRDTRRVMEQIPMFGGDPGALRSRAKIVEGLTSSLRLIMDKANAQCGFIAIRSAKGEGFDIVCREELSLRDARRVKAVRDGLNGEGIIIREASQDEAFAVVSDAVGPGTMVFQDLGFDGEDLGLIFIGQDGGGGLPIGQEALHFVGAYSRLISLSVYELVRNERRQEYKSKTAGSGFESILTENQDMLKLLNLAERVAHSNATVLLQGETGTGKGLIAYAIHLLSERRDRRFVHINCAALPETLLESELFGHVRGAFTGAIADKEGLLRQADGGTIFLDEIGKTSLAMQGKLLQFLDTSKVRKVGSNELIPVDVRVVCASKADLLEMCNDGRFLEDFFYRINDFPLTVPPLRRRPEDIPLLFYHYLRKFSAEMDKGILDVTDEAMTFLRSHVWSGNVRELEKIVKRAVILADEGDTINPSHLPPEITQDRGPVESKKTSSLRSQISRLERREILAALERNGWNKSQAATDLEMSYPSLLSKIKRYGLRRY